MKMQIVNLTPHVLNIDGLVIEPTKPTPRLNEIRYHVSQLDVDGKMIDVVRVHYGATTHLPPLISGLVYIVSQLVKQANPTRLDLYSPGELVRDDKGNVIGCKDIVNNF
jgi:hypothetical protein